jgi:menaquinone-dependent protoporphyrinogen oxidase
VASIFIPYATREGQTAKIAEYIADVVRDHGYAADTVDIAKARDGLPTGCDGVIVGSSIHMGKHDKHAREFVRRHREALERVPAAFFSVSLAAHGDEQEAERYVEEFVQETGWHPARVAIFSGALLYTQYGFIKRRLMHRIAEDKPGSLGTDVARDYFYTEWDGVRRFAEDFLAGLDARPAATG